MPYKIDLTGKVFGKLTVLEDAGRTRDKKLLWKCICACGNAVIVRAVCLSGGQTKSCGCSSQDSKITHGMASEPVYRVWASIVQRTTNPKNSQWEYYGGRGIVLCEKWKAFEGFWDDMRQGYSPELSIERRDVDKGYDKSNCYWAEIATQQHNKRKQKNRSSMFLGVGFHKTSGKWQAQIAKNKVTTYLGLFTSEIAAATAYDNVAEELYGDRPNKTTREIV